MKDQHALIAITLSACKSTKTAVKPEQVMEISFSELGSYWIEEPTKIKRHKGRPDFIPSGRGHGSYAVTIYSNGDVVRKELVDSSPSGWLTQSHVDKMPTKNMSPLLKIRENSLFESFSRCLLCHVLKLKTVKTICLLWKTHRSDYLCCCCRLDYFNSCSIYIFFIFILLVFFYQQLLSRRCSD